MNNLKHFVMCTFLFATLMVSLGLAVPMVRETTQPAVADLLPTLPSNDSVATDDDEEEATEDFAPIDNMHHFMEYICEPSYKGLKESLATEPANRNAWKSFKNHALVLAETSALVAARAPEDEKEAKEWKQISLAVYQSGKALYKSSGNYEDAKQHFGSMIDHCNKCHLVFAEGKHQLEK